jgi:hypothetical protein
LKLGALPVWLCCAGLVLCSAAVSAKDDESLADAWGRAGQGIRAATRETGHALRDVAKATGKTAERGAREAGHATRDAMDDFAAKNSAADNSAAKNEGTWERVSRGLAEALDDLAEALRGLRDDPA